MRGQDAGSRVQPWTGSNASLEKHTGTIRHLRRVQFMKNTKIEITNEMRRFNAAVELVDHLFDDQAERITNWPDLAWFLQARGAEALAREVDLAALDISSQ
jgi:hypothetical protein